MWAHFNQDQKLEKDRAHKLVSIMVVQELYRRDVDALGLQVAAKTLQVPE